MTFLMTDLIDPPTVVPAGACRAEVPGLLQAAGSEDFSYLVMPIRLTV